MRLGGTGSLPAPLTQPCGEFLCRFILARRRSKQTFEVVDRSDTLLRSQFLEGRRGGELRSRRYGWVCPLVHESRITRAPTVRGCDLWPGCRALLLARISAKRGSCRDFTEHFGMQFCDPKQCLCRSARRAASLLPLLQPALGDSKQSGELHLCQTRLQSRSHDRRTGLSRNPFASAGSDLAHTVQVIAKNPKAVEQALGSQ